MPPKPPLSTEQRVVLSSISWQQYERLLAELGVKREARLTYFRGKLELMTPMESHDRCHKLIESLILVLADELKMEVEPFVPAVVKAPEQDCATEFDACYFFDPGDYFQQQGEIYIPDDPAPDLAIEVALTKSSIDKLKVYALLEIPEVWRYVTTAGDEVLQGQLRIYQLEGERYVETETSAVFPFLSADRICAFIRESDDISLATALRVFRAWIQEVLPS